MPKKNFKNILTKFSFGATSSIITSLGLIIGLNKIARPQFGIIGGLLLIGLADNISDGLGIHIYQESESLNKNEVWFSTITNFITRFLVSLVFIIFVLFFPINIAVVLSVIYGLLVLLTISYFIAKKRKTNSLPIIIEHIAIAGVVIAASHFLSRLILGRM